MEGDIYTDLDFQRLEELTDPDPHDHLKCCGFIEKEYWYELPTPMRAKLWTDMNDQMNDMFEVMIVRVEEAWHDKIN